MSMNDEEPLTIRVAPIKTEEEIARLYRDWYGHPIWDLENTEGFEAHHERLLQMRLEQEARWKAAREQREAERRRLIQEYASNHKCSREHGRPSRDSLRTSPTG